MRKMKQRTKANRFLKILSVICIAFLLMSGLSLTAFAAGEDIFALGDRIIRDVYNHIAGISTVLAALMSAVAVIGAKMSGTQQKADAAWSWLKRVWLAWAVINGIGAFIAYVQPLFDGYNYLP